MVKSVQMAHVTDQIHTEPNASSSERTPFWSWFLLAAVGLAILIPGTMQLPLIDRDEPRFSRATVEMEQRGECLVPYFNDEYRFDKPPLTYWWMRANYAIFGHNEFGARFHSIVSAILVAWLVLGVGRDLFGWRVGFWAGLGWLTIVQVWIHGRLALADMPMIACLVLCHWAFWRLVSAETPPRRWGLWFWALWLGLGVGLLAKGPVILICLGATALLFRFGFWRREKLRWKRLQILTGLPVALLVFGAWGLPANMATDGLFLQVGIGRHVVDRGLEAFDDRRTIPVLFYLATAFISLFPWRKENARAHAVWNAVYPSASQV